MSTVESSNNEIVILTEKMTEHLRNAMRDTRFQQQQQQQQGDQMTSSGYNSVHNNHHQVGRNAFSSNDCMVGQQREQQSCSKETLADKLQQRDTMSMPILTVIEISYIFV